MNNQNLSVCIPSNRKFATSKESISSGIGFCEATNSELIVSDTIQMIKLNQNFGEN